MAKLLALHKAEIDKKHLDLLLPPIDSMLYQTIGDVSWIDIEEIKAQVQKKYLASCLDIIAFKELCEQTPSYQTAMEPIQTERNDRLQQLEDDHAAARISYDEYVDRITALHHEHQEKEQQAVRDWLAQQGCSAYL